MEAGEYVYWLVRFFLGVAVFKKRIYFNEIGAAQKE